jgi:hypothetical protein
VLVPVVVLIVTVAELANWTMQASLLLRITLLTTISTGLVPLFCISAQPGLVKFPNDTVVVVVETVTVPGLGPRFVVWLAATLIFLLNDSGELLRLNPVVTLISFAIYRLLVLLNSQE